MSSSSSSKASSSKSRFGVINSSSLFDLKAELEKGKEAFARQALNGSSSVQGIQRDKGKPSKWSGPSKGLAARQARQDASEKRLGKVDGDELARSKAALERKAKIYDSLRRGKTGGFSERQLDGALIDWETKAEERGSGSESETDVEKEATEDDPLTDYEDDFGRTRTVPRSEVPIYAMEQKRIVKAAAESLPGNLILGDQQYFPVYEPSAEDLKARMKAAEGPADEKHYDGNAEVRTKGAGFYQFSADAELRAKQQAELLATRAETEQARAEVEVGSVSSTAGGSTKAAPAPAPKKVWGGKASEKRKAEVEERRRLVQEKRQRKEVERLFTALEGDLAQLPGEATTEGPKE